MKLKQEVQRGTLKERWEDTEEEDVAAPVSVAQARTNVQTIWRNRQTATAADKAKATAAKGNQECDEPQPPTRAPQKHGKQSRGSNFRSMSTDNNLKATKIRPHLKTDNRFTLHKTNWTVKKLSLACRTMHC